MRYTSITPEEREEMLDLVGVGSIDALFADIPAGLVQAEPLQLAEGLGEDEVMAEFRRLAELNTSVEDETSFVGAGMYDHYVPAFIGSLMQRAEFLTPYTPYQPEASQGTLQLMFEYQTAISELTGLAVSNATLYDGPSGVAAAAYMAHLQHGVERVVVSRGVHPHSRGTLVTTMAALGVEVVEAPLLDGRTDLEALAQLGAKGAVIVQQPNFLGAVEDLDAIREASSSLEGSLICACDPIALGLLRTPGEAGFDIAVGEGQPLGNNMSFGGPTFGFIAATEAYLRKMPGRIAGETEDVDGRRGWCLTLQTREQFIRRERATSNITTAQTLNALGAITYLAWLGAKGLPALTELLVQRTNYLRALLEEVPGIRPVHSAPVVREFAVELDIPVDRVARYCQDAGISPGYSLSREYPEYGNALLIAVTERRRVEDLDALRATLAMALEAERGVLVP